MLNNILEYLEASAERLPDKIAFAEENAGLTFRQVMLSAQAIGTGLYRRGHTKAPVAILMDSRHIPYVQAMFGVAYSGCFYAPMDPSVPMDRLKILLERLQPTAILYDQKGAEAVASFRDQYDAVSFESLLEEEADEELLKTIRSQCSYFDPLCVMFTSGSTGVPKWVLHTHHSIHMWCLLTNARYQFSESTVHGNQSPFFYSNCFGSLYLPIMLGSSSYILSASVLAFPKKMVEALKEKHVSELCMTPSSWTAVADSGALDAEVIPDLKWITLSGEACNSQAIKKWLAVCPNAHVWNFYGSTEALSVSTRPLERDLVTEPGEVIPSGPLYPQVHMLIVDEDGQVLPPGEKGEMLVHTPCMCSGYYLDPERTNEAFVDDPLHKGYHEWFYRTGDLGYFNQRGQLVVTGRKDNMIKHKGYRMEMGEVETAAKAVEGCTDCACIHDKEKDVLYCFYTGSLSEEEMMKALRKILPRFALPDRCVRIEKIPYTSSVKVDRRALSPLLCD